MFPVQINKQEGVAVHTFTPSLCGHVIIIVQHFHHSNYNNIALYLCCVVGRGEMECQVTKDNIGNNKLSWHNIVDMI